MITRETRAIAIIDLGFSGMVKCAQHGFDPQLSEVLDRYAMHKSAADTSPQHRINAYINRYVMEKMAANSNNGGFWSGFKTFVGGLGNGIASGAASLPGMVGGLVGGAGGALSALVNGEFNKKGWERIKASAGSGMNAVNSIGGDWGLGAYQKWLAQGQTDRIQQYMKDNNIDPNNLSARDKALLFTMNAANAAGNVIGTWYLPGAALKGLNALRGVATAAKTTGGLGSALMNGWVAYDTLDSAAEATRDNFQYARNRNAERQLAQNFMREADDLKNIPSGQRAAYRANPYARTDSFLSRTLSRPGAPGTPAAPAAPAAPAGQTPQYNAGATPQYNAGATPQYNAGSAMA